MNCEASITESMWGGGNLKSINSYSGSFYEYRPSTAFSNRWMSLHDQWVEKYWWRFWKQSQNWHLYWKSFLGTVTFRTIQPKKAKRSYIGASRRSLWRQHFYSTTPPPRLIMIWIFQFRSYVHCLSTNHKATIRGVKSGTCRNDWLPTECTDVH